MNYVFGLSIKVRIRCKASSTVLVVVLLVDFVASPTVFIFPLDSAIRLSVVVFFLLLLASSDSTKAIKTANLLFI